MSKINIRELCICSLRPFVRSIALALLTSNEAALHKPAHDKRIVEACNASGGVDGGITFGTEPAVDDVALPGYSAITALARDIIKRVLRA